MIRMLLMAGMAVGATSLAAQDLKIDQAYIPLAPPGVMTNAAYLTLENSSDQPRSLIGVSAKGYGMAHLHESKTQAGIATMSVVHQLDIAPGQSITFTPGDIHIMLMHPHGRQRSGDQVPLTLLFANGEKITVPAIIASRDEGS